MTKARELSDIFADANTANELVKLDGSAKLPALDGSNLTGVAETKPTITSISPSVIDNTQTSIVITGTNYEITPIVELISTTGAVTYSKSSGDFPTGFTLNASTGVISGTESSSITQETNYNFTILATDAEGQTASRAFTITVSVGIPNSGQFN